MNKVWESVIYWICRKYIDNKLLTANCTNETVLFRHFYSTFALSRNFLCSYLFGSFPAGLRLLLTLTLHSQLQQRLNAATKSTLLSHARTGGLGIKAVYL